MDIQSRKILFVQEFLRLQNEELISQLENILKKNRVESYEKNLNPMTEKQFNEEIDQALDDSSNDKVVSVKDLKDRMRQWD